MMSHIVTAIIGAAIGARRDDRQRDAQQDFPTSPIQLMVAFPAGGSTDIAARIVAAIAEKALGQPIVVVNKGGAGGQVGWTELVRQRPDGYYIGFINLPATNTVILDPERKAIFTEKDFTPIINQVLDPGVIWVRADSPYKTVQDLIDAAKKSPSTIRAATTGILSDDHLAILMTEEAAPGAVFRLVHLEGGAAQFKEIMAGNIDVAFDNVGSIMTRVKSGEVRALAVHGRRALEVPARRADHEGAGLSDRHLELDPRDRGTEGHAGADRGQAARRAEESDGGPRARQQARRPGPRHQDHGGRGIRQVFRRHPRQGQEIHRVGEEPSAAVIPSWCASELNRFHLCSARLRNLSEPRVLRGAVARGISALGHRWYAESNAALERSGLEFEFPNSRSRLGRQFMDQLWPVVPENPIRDGFAR